MLIMEVVLEACVALVMLVMQVVLKVLVVR